ncbi:MAG: hypothetical protein MJ181_01760 [Treponema sp.]|nr:hypothetical protein [Treponema sp.]
MDLLTYSYSPSTANITPELTYEETKVQVTMKGNGLVLNALEEGQTSITVSYGKYSATCILTISGYEPTYEKVVEPYIYSNTSILQMSPGMSEKVFCSLYGGDAADINGYTWSVEDNSVCSVQPTGQYCIITAKATGYTRIKISHSRSTYPYYMGVYVFDDFTKTTYITTNDNILTLKNDDGDKSISVNLVNPRDVSAQGNFTWALINETEKAPVSIVTNGNKCVITPKANGVCTIRVTHPEAIYPLDIVCRVITIVENVYIEPDKTILTLSGTTEDSITSELKNVKDGIYSVDDFSYSLENEEVATITAAIGNQVFLKGKANGSTKLIIKHEIAEYNREVLVIATNQLTDAIDTTNYITTTQNYIKTKVGADPVSVNIIYKGGEEGDENNLIWTVKNNPLNGTNDVIKLETTNGSVNYSRAAKSNISGSAIITPTGEGTATISVSHPNVLYPTEILVKVLGKDAILEEPLYFTGEGILKIVNSTEKTYTVGLRGTNKLPTDEQAIKWEPDDIRITVLGNESNATVKAPPVGTGTTISHINITHPKVDSPKKILVLTADTEEELENIKALYSDKLYYNIKVGDSANIFCEQVGFKDTESTDENGEKKIIPYDFSRFNWKVNDPTIISILKDSGNPRQAKITALKPGSTKLYGSIDGYSCEFSITVYPESAVNIEPDVYFTTTQNVVYFSDINTSKNISIKAINLNSSKLSEITWQSENEEICSVIGNGNSGHITANKIGETVINITHPDSQNTLKIYIRIGNQYVIKETDPVVYISCQDVITMLRDDSSKKLQATLVNCPDETPNQFNFSIDNEEIAKISAQSLTGIAFISPVASGQAEITVTNSITNITKKVLVIVGNTKEELSNFTYLSTDTNVVTIGEGNTRNVNVTIKNSSDIILDGYTWTSSDYNIVDVTPNASTAILKANKAGVARITVTNSTCKYPLEIIVQVVDPLAAAANPYIQLSSSVLVTNIGDNYSNITADLIGGTEEDYSDFIWETNDPTVCTVYGQNQIGKIKAVGKGQSYITVRHPKSLYSAQVLVVVDEKTKSECYISVPSSILQLKPTDAAKTITASLVNGTSTDKYNFQWSLDVYDVIDFQYAANVCTIIPKQTGTTTITISHPKAEYNQQIIVTVSEYTTFGFPDNSVSITQGEVKFLNMQVPTTTVKTHIEYKVANGNICSVTGTKSVVQITGVTSGTTTVTAKLIATTTGVEQASAEMMIYVKEKPVNAAYITSGSTIYTVAKGKSQTLTASISGTDITSPDQANLKWTTKDTDKIQITGISQDGSVHGQSIYITALSPGEAIITCSHEKAASDLQFFIVIPGSGAKTISLDKTYITIVKGGGSSTLTASIDNLESNDDYNQIEWDSVGPNQTNGSNIVKIMGSGKKVQLYPVNPGEATIYARLPGAPNPAKCTVIVEAGKSFQFENTALRITPYQSKTVQYTVSPPNAIITWTRSSDDDYWDYEPSEPDINGNGTVTFTGLKEGQGVLIAATDGGATSKITVKTSWSYDLKIQGNTNFNITPKEQVKLSYTVCPSNTELSAEGLGVGEYFTVAFNHLSNSTDANNNETATGEIVINPLKECNGELQFVIKGTNPTNGGIVGEKRISGIIKYPSYTPTITQLYRNGKFSRITDSGIYIADGEILTFEVGIEESNPNGYVESLVWNAVSNPDTNIKKQLGFISSVSIANESQNKKSFSITHSRDITNPEPRYKIEKLFVPVYDGVRVDWKTNITWRTYYKNLTFGGKDDYYGLSLIAGHVNNSNPDNEMYTSSMTSSQKNGWLYAYSDSNWSGIKKSVFLELEEEEIYRGYDMSQKEFESYAWLYCPGVPNVDSSDRVITKNDFDNGTISNGSFGNGAQIHATNVGAPRVMTENVIATRYEKQSENTVATSQDLIGYITVNFNHAGLGESIPNWYPVYVEVYECLNK